MTRSVVLAASLLLGACGTETDDRPQTLAFVNEAILGPSCGTANCHSSYTGADNYSFGTIDEAQASLGGGAVIPTAPDDSLLYQVLVSPGGDGAPKQMPRDQPLANDDIQLIRDWITNGAEGLVVDLVDL